MGIQGLRQLAEEPLPDCESKMWRIKSHPRIQLCVVKLPRLVHQRFASSRRNSRTTASLHLVDGVGGDFCIPFHLSTVRAAYLESPKLNGTELPWRP